MLLLRDVMVLYLCIELLLRSHLVQKETSTLNVCHELYICSAVLVQYMFCILTHTSPRWRPSPGSSVPCVPPPSVPMSQRKLNGVETCSEVEATSCIEHNTGIHRRTWGQILMKPNFINIYLTNLLFAMQEELRQRLQHERAQLSVFYQRIPPMFNVLKDYNWVNICRLLLSYSP